MKGDATHSPIRSLARSLAPFSIFGPEKERQFEPTTEAERGGHCLVEKASRKGRIFNQELRG